MPTAEGSAPHPERVASLGESRTKGGAAEFAPHRDASRGPKADLQPGQFGPLPLVLRPAPQGATSADKKVRRDRRGKGNGGNRAIIFRWLIGIALIAVVAWSLTSVLAQQKPGPPKPSPPKPAPAQQQQQPPQQQPQMPEHRAGALSDPFDLAHAQR